MADQQRTFESRQDQTYLAPKGMDLGQKRDHVVSRKEPLDHPSDKDKYRDPHCPLKIALTCTQMLSCKEYTEDQYAEKYRRSER